VKNEKPSNITQNNDVNKTVKVKQTAPIKQETKTPQEVADHLVKLALSVPNVKKATAVVIGNYAVVGIDVDANLDRPRVGTIKYTVAEALREDPLGAKALVTADPDLVQRLKELNEDIKRGRPIAGLAEELADIVGRIIPQVPKDVRPKEELNTKENPTQNFR